MVAIGDRHRCSLSTIGDLELVIGTIAVLENLALVLGGKPGTCTGTMRLFSVVHRVGLYLETRLCIIV